MRPWLRDLLGTRFELRLGDPIDSEVDGKLAATVPARPGRGLTRDGLHFLSALPRIDGDSRTDDLAAATAEPGGRGWTARRRRGTGRPAAPGRAAGAGLPAPGRPARGGFQVPLGHRRVSSSPRCGTTSTPARTCSSSATRRPARPTCCGMLARSSSPTIRRTRPGSCFGDFRRELYDAVPQAHQIGYSVSTDNLTATIRRGGGALRTRVPGPDITPDRLAADGTGGPAAGCSS